MTYNEKRRDNDPFLQQPACHSFPSVALPSAGDGVRRGGMRAESGLLQHFMRYYSMSVPGPERVRTDTVSVNDYTSAPKVSIPRTLSSLSGFYHVRDLSDSTNEPATSSTIGL